MKIKSVMVVLLLSVSLIFTSCLEQEAVYNSISINTNDFADAMGNGDGVASTEEIEVACEYFINNPMAYFMTGSIDIINPPLNGSEIERDFFMLSDVYSSEIEMREAYEGMGIKTPWVAISKAVLINDRITITHIYRVPGPNVYGGKWERVEVE